MQNAIAFCDNDVVVVAWSYGMKLAGCMGFAVYRIDAAGTETALPSMAVFPGFVAKPGQTTAAFPVQKFYWKDPYARLVADRTGTRSFRYKVVPLSGQPGKLKPMKVAFLVSNEIAISPVLAPGVAAVFNRGLISTQRVSNALGGKPSKAALLAAIAKREGALRKSLAGDMIPALLAFVARAKSGGALYAALYELGDDELIGALEGAGKRLHLILSNPSAADEQSASAITDGNSASRQRLAKTAGQLIDRMFSDGQIGHNKYVVYVDRHGTAKAVLFGSTNWTSTGLCAQTNNTMVWDDASLARRYLDDWKRLAADTLAAKGDPKQLQAAPLRTWDATAKTLSVAGGAKATSWFSPNTPKLRGTIAKEVPPPDMKEVAQLIAGAQHAVLFLVFFPGSPSVASWAGAAQKANKDLFVRGCVTNPSAAESFHYELHGTKGKQDARVIQAQALDDDVPAGWKKEILSAGFAVTHDKILVVDPFSPACAVVTGSHNLGHRASFNNDENLVIVRGQRALAAAYATHVLDIYDHFSWRWTLQNRARAPGAPEATLSLDSDAWQSRYFDSQGNIKVAQLRFWLSALPAL
jgi:hypothetical protein